MPGEPPIASIRITRTSAYVNRIRKFAVFIDGSKVGKIANGATETYKVVPGDHEVSVKIDWCRSRTLVLYVAAGETVDLACGSVASAGESIGAVFSGAGAYIDVWLTDDAE